MIGTEQNHTAWQQSADLGLATDYSAKPLGSEVIELFRSLLLQEIRRRQVSQ